MSAIHCGISCFSASADFGFWADRQRVEARRARVIFFIGKRNSLRSLGKSNCLGNVRIETFLSKIRSNFFRKPPGRNGAGDVLSDLGRGSRVISFDEMSPVIGTGVRVSVSPNHNKFNILREPFGVFPARQGIPLIKPQNQEKTAVVSKCILEFAQGFPRVGRRWLFQLEVTDMRPMDILDCDLDHF